MKIDIKDMVVLKGQDHCWWIYSNKLDKYFHTDISCNQVTEEELISNFEFGNGTWISNLNYDV